MRIAVEGCAHGELEIIYGTVQEIEKTENTKVDLLICCGDFQATRNLTDLSCMAIPDKFKEMCSFYKYYSGEKVAPVLTIFIGGNHEASNYLQELPYGGWVAPNIYYLGYAGVINIAGLRIAGISGIYNSQNWLRGHHEKPPYTKSSMRSVYHTRNLEVFRLKQLSGKIDIFLSHDWPRGITQYGNEKALLKIKPFFKDDIEADALGNPACMELLEHHYPSYWFAAHLHCKFAAMVSKKEDSSKVTKFLALDKCLPKRKFLQILDIPHEQESPIQISYDPEWLTILYLTNHLLSVKTGLNYMPGQGGEGRWNYTPAEEELENVSKKFENQFLVPENFVRTADSYDPESTTGPNKRPKITTNPQTTLFCDKLGIDDPVSLLCIMDNTPETSYVDSSPDKTLSSMGTSFVLDVTPANSTLDDDSSSDSSDQASPLPPTFRNTPLILPPIVCQKSPTTEIEEENIVECAPEIPTVDIVIDTVGTNVSTEPDCKKFKRRNHSMYSNTY